MAWVAGIDGCKTGWIVVLQNLNARTFDHRLIRNIGEASSFLERPHVVAVDIPIGLLDEAVPAVEPVIARPASCFSSPERAPYFRRPFALR